MTPPPSNASRFSLTAFTLPGRVTTSVSPTVPATGRASAASGVFCSDAAIMRCTSPGASRSMRGRIACRRASGVTGGQVSPQIHSPKHAGRTSGVRSRTPNPVPPVVTIQSTSPCAAHVCTVCRMRGSSSGTTSRYLHS